MPHGTVRGISISRDDAAFAFYASDGSVPDELYAGPITAAPSRLTNALNPSIRREDLVVPTVVRFKSYDNVEIPGVLYKPHQASAAAKAPGVVLVHGGPGGQAQVGYSALTQALVNHGYVVFDINNRGSSGYGKTFFAMDDKKHGEADLGDVVASKKMLVDTGYVDAARIGIIGGSYGGYMVLAALTLQPDAFKVGVDLFGISNWVRTLTSIPPWWGSFKDALYAEMGEPTADSERLHRVSPLFNADKIKAPLMVLQGANDPRVLKVESDEIVAAAKKNGVPVEYIVFPDEGHGFVKKENEIKGYTAVIAFLDKYSEGTSDGRDAITARLNHARSNADPIANTLVEGNSRRNMSKRIYVGNLSYQTTENDLTNLFEQVGQVEAVKIITDRDTGRSKGFGFLEMGNEDADKAIAQLARYHQDDPLSFG